MLQEREHKEKRKRDPRTQKEPGVCHLGGEKPQYGWLAAKKNHEGQRYPVQSSLKLGFQSTELLPSESIMLGSICYRSHRELILTCTKIHPCLLPQSLLPVDFVPVCLVWF